MEKEPKNELLEICTLLNRGYVSGKTTYCVVGAEKNEDEWVIKVKPQQQEVSDE